MVDEYYYVYADAGEGGLDGTVRDGGIRDSATDGSVDGANPDGSHSTQVVITRPCVREGGTPDFCSCASFGAVCDPSHPCAFGSVCLNNGCGTFCQPGGARCAVERDCTQGTTCTGGFCARSQTGCTDSRDCADGFSCDFGQCIDRRIPCQRAEHCPWGYMCVQGQGEPLCMKLYRNCGSNAACGDGFVCEDADRDDLSLGNCVPADGVCSNSSQCNAGNSSSCGSMPTTRYRQCVPFGPCATTADCVGDQRCLDLWGDGVKECAPGTGQCATSSDCPQRSVCAVVNGGTELRCVTGMYSQ